MAIKKKSYIILLTFILITTVLVMFFVYPLLREIKINSEELLLEKKRTATLEFQAKETETFQKNYSLYAPNLEKIEQLFIDSKDPVDFIKFLEKTASNSGITSKISLLPSPEKDNQNFISFQFFSNGDFSKILEFSEKLETGPYLIEIKNLVIKNSTNQNVDANFLIKVFTKQQ